MAIKIGKRLQNEIEEVKAKLEGKKLTEVVNKSGFDLVELHKRYHAEGMDDLMKEAILGLARKTMSSTLLKYFKEDNVDLFIAKVIKSNDYMKTATEQYEEVIEGIKQLKSVDKARVQIVPDKCRQEVVVRKKIGMSLAEAQEYFRVDARRVEDMVTSGFIATFVDTIMKNNVLDYLGQGKDEYTVRVGRVYKSEQRKIYTLDVDMVMSIDENLTANVEKVLKELTGLVKQLKKQGLMLNGN